MVPEGVTPESVVNVDNDVITTAPMITDDDILTSVKTQQEESDGDDEDEEEVAPKWPSRFQVQSAIDVIRNAALYSSNGEDMSLTINKFEKLFTEERFKSAKQKEISDFFKRVWLKKTV